MSADLLLALLLAAGLCALVFTTSGGVSDPVGGGDTWSEIVLELLGAVVVGAAMLRGRLRAGASLALLALLTLLTGLSIAWSVQPDYSWQATGQMLAYLASFGAAAMAARIWPGRWPVLVAAVTLAACALSAYALAFKVFPATLDTAVSFTSTPLGRLQGPLGYWNATGLMAALGFAGCLWAGSRLRARPWQVALSACGISVLVPVVVLSFSRSAVLAAAVAVVLWMAGAPGRLRSVAVAAVGAVGGAVLSAWALSRPALSADGQALGARTAAGHTFGLVILAAVLLTGVAGLLLGRAFQRIEVGERARRRIGTALLAVVALAVLAGIGGLAASHRGLTGEVSHAWSTLTSAGSQVGNSSQRLLQLGSSRGTYWREGLRVGEHNLLAGVGAEAFGVASTAYTATTEPVQSAHSYLVETFADLGLIGLVLTLALLLAWGRAALRALGRARPRERAGMLALTALVAAFGVQSAIDWTWFFPAVAVPALLCAGWLAGCEPPAEPEASAAPSPPTRGAWAVVPRTRLGPGALAGLTGLAAVTLLAAWITWQPLRSADQLSAAYDSVAAGRTAQAFTDARQAADIDPVSIWPLQTLSALYAAVGDPAQARAELVQATERQPRNPETWEWLGSYDLQRSRPRRAVSELGRALRLDLGDHAIAAMVAEAQAASARS